MNNQTIVADATLIIIRTASSATTRASRIELLSARVGQFGSTTSQNLGIMIAKKVSAFGTYTSTTPEPIEVGTTASGITGSTSAAAASAGTDASAEGAGAATPIVIDAFNVLNGWLWVPVPEERIVVPLDTAVVLKIIGTPGSLVNWNACLSYRELT